MSQEYATRPLAGVAGKSRRALFVTALLTIAAAGEAAAVETPEARAAATYLRGFGAFEQLDSHTVTSALGRLDHHFDGGFKLGAAAGIESDWLRRFAPGAGLGSRFEMEYAYQDSALDEQRIAGARLAPSTGDVRVHSLMGNALVDFNTGRPLNFYLGGGLGVAFVDFAGFGSGGVRHFDDRDTAFAYQGIAGAEYRIDPRWSVFAEYRYFGTDDSEIELYPVAGGGREDLAIDAHSIGGGVRFRF